MANLAISSEKEQKLDKLESSAIEIMQEVMDDKRDVDDTAKAAVKLLGVVAKNRQTMTAREALGFNMASVISNEKQLKKYVEITNPQIKKAISSRN